MNWLFRWWRRRQRSIDMKVLWPTIKDQTEDLDHARSVFFFHVVNDTAWTDDYGTEELAHLVGELT